MIGVPRYDITSCTYYVIQKLRENGFNVQLLQYNFLYISWIEESLEKDRKEKTKFFKF